jgi:hypothetical protein
MTNTFHNLSQCDSTISNSSHNFTRHLTRDDTISIVAFITLISQVLIKAQGYPWSPIALSELGDIRRHNRVAVGLLVMDDGFEVRSNIFLYCLL